MTVEAILSRADGSDEAIDLASWRPRDIHRNELLWIDLTAPTQEEAETVSRALDLDDETAEILGEGLGEPDVTVHHGGVEVIVQAPGEHLDDPPRALRALVGDGWVVTAHPDRLPFVEGQREQIQDQREVGSLTPTQFLISVLDWLVKAYFHAADELEKEVDLLDEAALRSERDLLNRLVQMRRRIASVRRMLTPHRELFAELARLDMLGRADEHEREALLAVAGRLDRAADAIGNAREMLIGTFDVHMTRTAQRTNDVMKVLTLASVILLPAVVLAGVMGMNFQVGFFENTDLFWVVIGVMVTLAVGTVAAARWRGWL